jgi:DNA-binding XRE family transcriptional regulator
MTPWANEASRYDPIGSGAPPSGSNTVSSAQLASSARTRTGLSVEGFAEVLGTSAGNVRAWESGAIAPSAAVCRLLDLIGSDAFHLVSGWKILRLGAASAESSLN